MTTPTRKNEYRVPYGAPIKHCASCHRAIIWTTTVSQRRIPLSVASIRTDSEGTRWALPHFVDCPDAEAHRKSAITTPEPAMPPEPPPGPAMGAGTKTAVKLNDLADYLDNHGLRIQSTRANEYDPLVIGAIAINAGARSPCPRPAASEVGQNEGR